ncbi:MAG: hypothetical protein K8S18_00480 [Desulfobacula sp.]|nr:hypothetical protein [Desulfobacula sp.]
MDINSLQGANAYTSVPNATPPVENTQLRDQNLEASKTDLREESANAAQKAFEVNITRQAQDKLAAEATEESVETQTTTPENQTNQNIIPAHERSQIVNIVA